MANEEFVSAVQGEDEREGPLGPLTIYVAWHPKCEDGQVLAEGIYKWFRSPSLAVQRAGSGIPVYYRSQPWSESGPVGSEQPAKEECFLRPIRFEDAAMNVVIPIIDENMVDSAKWRGWLYDVGTRHAEHEWIQEQRQSDPDIEDPTSIVVAIPVQLHDSISRLDVAVSGINAIRVDNWNDDDGGDTERRRERRRRRARRYLVQALVRTLRQQREPNRRDLLPRSIFLSHAKADLKQGAGVAEKIRTEALTQGQIDTFFDASQLEWGKRWRKPMTSAAGELTAAFIAIFGDLYPTRFWCREELRLARRPRSLARKASEAAADESRREYWNRRIWSVQPIVIVDTMDGEWSYLLPEMSGAPIVRWNDSSSNCAAEVLDRVMLEALRSEVQVRHAVLMANKRCEDQDDVFFLTWVPDPHTLMEWGYSDPDEDRRIRPKLPICRLPENGDTEPDDPQTPKTRVVFPGHGLGQVDDRLRRYLGSTIDLMSMEEFEKSTDPEVELESEATRSTKGMACIVGPQKEPPTDDQEPPDGDGDGGPEDGYDRKVAASSTSDQFRKGQADEQVDPRFDQSLPLIQLSVGDPDIEELYALGYGSEHLDDAVYRVATALLEKAALAYGGVLRSTGGFLDSIIDAVAMTTQKRMAAAEASKKDSDDKDDAESDNSDGSGNSDDRPTKPPTTSPTLLHSFQAWDFYLRTGKEHRARHHGLCCFHDILPASDSPDKDLPDQKMKAWESLGLDEPGDTIDEELLADMRLPVPNRLDRSLVALYRARALLRMRMRVCKKSDALVAMGGKKYGWSGFAPGVLEEVCLMHRANKPVIVIPEFGGASRAIAAWILDESPDDKFELLSFEHQWATKYSKNSKLREVVAGLRQDRELTETEATAVMTSYYDELYKQALSYRETIRGFIRRAGEENPGEDGKDGKHKTDYFGLTPKQVKRLMTTGSMGMVRHLLVNCLVQRLKPRVAA